MSNNIPNYQTTCAQFPTISTSTPSPFPLQKFQPLNGSQELLSQSGRQDLCELPRDNPGFLNQRRSSTMSLPAQGELLNDDSPLNGGRHNTFGAYNLPLEDNRGLSSSQIYQGSLLYQIGGEKPNQEIGPFGQKPVHECVACGKALCSIRSLKRHKNTCKRARAQHDPNTSSAKSSNTTETVDKNKSMDDKVIQHFEFDQINPRPYSSTTEQRQPIIQTVQKNKSQLDTASHSSTKETNSELSKVSDVVDSVVAKIRSQNSNKTTTPNMEQNVDLKKYQHSAQHYYFPIESKVMQQQQQQFMHTQTVSQQQREFPIPIGHQSSKRPQQLIANVATFGIIETKKEATQLPPKSQTHTCSLMEPPKSAPVPTTATSIHQFWPVMGSRVMLPVQSDTCGAANTEHIMTSPSPMIQSSSTQYKTVPKDQFISSPPSYPHTTHSFPTTKLITEEPNQKWVEPIVNPAGPSPANISSNSAKLNLTETNIGDSQSGKNVYRYLCPECDKPYSCRKNVKRHRISQHKVSSQEAQDGYIKRIRLSETELQQQQEQQKGMNKLQLSNTNLKTKTQPLEQKTTSEKEKDESKSTHSIQPMPNSHITGLAEARNNIALGTCQQSNFLHPYQGITPHSAPLPNQNQNQQHFFVYPNPYCSDDQSGYASSSSIPMDHFYANDEQHPQHFYPHNHQSYPPKQFQQQCIIQPQQQSILLERKGHQHNLNMPIGGQQQPQFTPSNLLEQQRQNPSHIQQKQILGGFAQNNILKGPTNMESSFGDGDHHYPFNNAHQLQFNQQYQPNMNTNYLPQHQYNIGSYQQQQFGQEPQQQSNASNTGSYAAETDLECWEQIKSRVDQVQTSDTDAIEMARIIEDLKRTEHVAGHKQQVMFQQQTQNQRPDGFIQFINGMESQEDVAQQFGAQRKAVELAEADTTFSPPSHPDDTSSSSTASRHLHTSGKTSQQYNHLLPLGQILPESSPSYTMLNAHQSNRGIHNFNFDVGQSELTQKANEADNLNKPVYNQPNVHHTWNSQGMAQKNQLTLNDNKGSSTKLVQTTSQKKPHTSAKISPTNSNFICLECNKAYSTDYSLKRHRQVCPVRNGQEKNNGGGIRKRKTHSNSSVSTSTEGEGKGRMEENHNVDPDSTMNESPPEENRHFPMYLGGLSTIMESEFAQMKSNHPSGQISSSEPQNTTTIRTERNI